MKFTCFTSEKQVFHNKVISFVYRSNFVKKAPFRVLFGWGSWIRTNVMQESKSCALPLGDTPIFFMPDSRPDALV